MEKRLKEVLNREEGNYILPFFWQHGEDGGRLREMMGAVYSSGIRAVCVESRPHPDFAGLVERYGYYYGRGAEKEYACLGSG